MPELSSKYSLYPSGFVGSKQVPKIEPINSSKDMIETSIVGRVGLTVGKGNLIIIDEELLQLYKLYMINPIVSADFEFREEVIKIALRIFGTYSFTDWYRLQLSSPSFGNNHHKFLDETINYLKYGVPRELRLETWTSLINYHDEKLTLPFPSKLFNDTYSVGGNGTDSIPDVIQTWMSQDEGFDDMFQTLFLMFGHN